MPDGSTYHYNEEKLKPYFWIYAPIVNEIGVRRPKKFGHHKTITDLIGSDPVLANKKQNRFWGGDSVIPAKRRKVVLWEQTHPLPNGSVFPEQAITDRHEMHHVANAISHTVKNTPLCWGGKGLLIAKSMTSASLSLAFNDEAKRGFQDFLSSLNHNIRATGLHVGDHRAGKRIGVVKLAKRGVSKKGCDEIKDMAEKLANKFKRMTTHQFDIQDIRLGMSLYNERGERISSRDVAIVCQNGLVKKQQQSTAQRILAAA